MARGITESDVHTAADELVASGDRPTVERIRAHLGTGSPNTVTRWLETWWKNLGIRLQPKRPDLKDAPAALAELAGQWWTLALQHARESVLEELAHARQTLAAEYDELRVQQQNFAEEASELHAKATASAHAERLALTQVTELRQLVDQLQSQLAESAQQRASADQRLAQVESARHALETRLHELQELARSERESLIEHARSVENRALHDIDLARQEAKSIRTLLIAADKKHSVVEADLRRGLQQAQESAITATAEADRLKGKNAAIEEQLAKFQHLPADLEAAIRRAQSSPRVSKTGGRRMPTKT
ncbi:DNA-binding protein [Stenotrophomonas sp.]|uniref:DNA-binding protein n=1 Tax=Stenotrophomonas sp. TaxID=69392 RepID=UPI0028AFF19E|nr:DNA-binding protein [Stenotrophomonas sp.]